MPSAAAVDGAADRVEPLPHRRGLRQPLVQRPREARANCPCSAPRRRWMRSAGDALASVSVAALAAMKGSGKDAAISAFSAAFDGARDGQPRRVDRGQVLVQQPFVDRDHRHAADADAGAVRHRLAVDARAPPSPRDGRTGGRCRWPAASCRAPAWRGRPSAGRASGRRARRGRARARRRDGAARQRDCPAPWRTAPGSSGSSPSASATIQSAPATSLPTRSP